MGTIQPPQPPSPHNLPRPDNRKAPFAWQEGYARLVKKLTEHVPPPLLSFLAKLTPPQRRMMKFVATGLGIFIVIWLGMSSLRDTPTRIISARQLQIPSKERGVNTAITRPAENFPAQRNQTASPVRQDLIDTLNLTPLQKSQLLELRQNVDNIYKNVLSFPLDEAKMIVFAQAATKIDMINAKWDTLIAGAPDDKLAAEYLTSATLESRNVMSNNQALGIPEKEYAEIYKLSARDASFNKIANAYKQLVAEGIWGPVTPVPFDRAQPSIQSADPALRFPAAPTLPPTPASGTNVIPPVQPAGGTGPAPQG